MRNIKSFLFILITCTILTAYSQQTILDRFQATVNNSQVYLSWTIKQGSTCNGISITRSVDSLTFVEIGDIEGICGDALVPVNYNFTDANPMFNRKNYYRLELGDVGPSNIISVAVISLDSKGYYVFPNPGNVSSRIYFENTQFEKAELKLFTVNGEITGNLITQKDFFDVDLTGYNAGLYLFLIYLNSKPVSGKIVVR
jgi:hypothetical protein